MQHPARRPTSLSLSEQDKQFTFRLEGDLDLHAFLGLPGARAGFTEIRAKARVSSPNATDDELAELCRYVQETSPVRDCLANRVPLTTSLEVL